jgi:hypothetical protein
MTKVANIKDTSANQGRGTERIVKRSRKNSFVTRVEDPQQQTNKERNLCGCHGWVLWKQILLQIAQGTNG